VKITTACLTEIKSMKKNLLLILLVVVAGTLASVVIASRRAVAQPVQSSRPIAVATAQFENRTTAMEISPPEKNLEPATAEKKSTTKLDSKKQLAGKTSKPPKEIQDPEARAALSLVGADPDAEQYWADAINDPNLPANERKDLIEDLNEDGLSDPKHPGPQDLPLIVNRLRLIDELAPYAMDQVNADAFQEAQKDLLAMLDGKPVQ